MGSSWGLDEDDETWRRVMSEMTFLGLEIWDLGIMPRVGVREVGEIDWLGRAINWNGLARAWRHWRTGRTQKDRGPGFVGTQ